MSNDQRRREMDKQCLTWANNVCQRQKRCDEDESVTKANT